MYSMHNEWKLVAVQRFIGTLNNKMYKYLASLSKNVFIYKLIHIVAK